MLAAALPHIIVLLTLGPLPADGQPPAGAVTPIDAVSASPDQFRVLLENPHVRVIEYVLLPGERDQWHTHPPKVSYVVSGGTLRITTADGQSFLADESTGSAHWAETVGRHFVQNVGKTPVRSGYYAYFGRYQVSAAGDAITHFVETRLRPNEVGVAYQRAIRIEGGRLYISLQAEEDGVSRHRVLAWRRAE